MLRNVFDLTEFVSKYTEDLLDEFEELEEDGVDVYQYLNDYQAKYQAKLEEFFDSEYGEAFEFNASDIFGLKDEVKKAKKDFLLDIYSYASFEDFQKFNDYKKVAGFNNVLNYLSHIPHDFHLELYQNHQELFGDLRFSEIEGEVEKLFFELHDEVYSKFENKLISLDNELPYFYPQDEKELVYLLSKFEPNRVCESPFLRRKQ
ncbi:hypothetical protein [Campylobacter upsaliensis]|uniref:hypothetical protein n=1 Tax=Campylobacter upsaliensis TaxID=28080 RepID=UPI0022EA8D82|nr:hypothetical protein [Campylobacter upsaliensis]